MKTSKKVFIPQESCCLCLDATNTRKTQGSEMLLTACAKTVFQGCGWCPCAKSRAWPTKADERVEYETYPWEKLAWA